MKITLSLILGWFKTAEGSLKGYLNFKEISKVVLTAIMAGASTFGILGLLNNDLANIITDTTFLKMTQDIIAELTAQHYVALAFSILTLVAEAYRRYHQGQDKPEPPKPA